MDPKRLSLDGADCDALYHKPGHKGIKGDNGNDGQRDGGRDHAFGSDIGHVVVAGEILNKILAVVDDIPRRYT